jgi:NADPH:quinone reductase-like Zn-dependent oxidoreductase
METEKKMRGYMIENHGGVESLSLQELNAPIPQKGEVRVKLKTMALNHLDIWVRRGVPGHRFPLPLIPGCDGAGVIESTGSDVSESLIGTEIILSPGFSCGECSACQANEDPLCDGYGILGETRHGTCAEYVVVKTEQCLPKPKNISWEEAAAFPLSALTAASMLQKCRLRQGETLLVIAGTSGVGSMAIQIGKKLGARVIATASTAEKRDVAENMGADHTIDPEPENWWKTVKTLTEGRGADVIFENVGQATWDQSLLALARGGRLTTCGATTGSLVEVELKRLFFKNQQLIGSTMGSRTLLIDTLEYLEKGHLKPHIDSIHPLENLPTAHARMENRSSIGKIVITL